MDLKDAVAANLRRARDAKKMTQEELAYRAELSSRYVSRIETGAASSVRSRQGLLKISDQIGSVLYSYR